jgi:hypothetical protein
LWGRSADRPPVVGIWHVRIRRGFEDQDFLAVAYPNLDLLENSRRLDLPQFPGHLAQSGIGHVLAEDPAAVGHAETDLAAGGVEHGGEGCHRRSQLAGGLLELEAFRLALRRQ